MADTHRSAIIKNFKNIDQKKIYTLLELSNLILYLESEKIYRVRPKYQLNTPKPRTLQDLKNKIYVLKHINREILLTTDQLDIQDPFGRSAATYLQVAKKIKDNIIIVFNYLFDTKLNRGKQDG
jgi:protein-tyrosine-phosphatase